MVPTFPRPVRADMIIGKDTRGRFSPLSSPPSPAVAPALSPASCGRPLCFPPRRKRRKTGGKQSCKADEQEPANSRDGLGSPMRHVQLRQSSIRRIRSTSSRVEKGFVTYSSAPARLRRPRRCARESLPASAKLQREHDVGLVIGNEDGCAHNPASYARGSSLSYSHYRTDNQRHLDPNQ